MHTILMFKHISCKFTKDKFKTFNTFCFLVNKLQNKRQSCT